MSSRRLSQSLPLALALAVASPFAGAQAQETKGDESPVGSAAELPQELLLIEPRSMATEVFVLLPGARKTVLTAARPGPLGTRHYRKEEFRAAFPGGWKAFYAKGLAAAAEHLKTLKPTFKRDPKKVIEYAVVESDHPLTATTILLPQFRSLFTDTLGEQLQVAIPNRSTVIVFPKLASKMPEYHGVLADLFKDAVYPASAEIFELTEDGIRVIGAFRAD